MDITEQEKLEKRREYHRKWRKAHPDKERAYALKYQKMHPEKFKEIREKARLKEPFYRKRYLETAVGFFTRMLWQLHKRKHGCTLTVADLTSMWYVQGGVCVLTGELMVLGGYAGRSMYRASVDRINPGLGYIRGNVRLVCAWANIARYVLNDEDFYAWCGKAVRKGKTTSF